MSLSFQTTSFKWKVKPKKKPFHKESPSFKFGISEYCVRCYNSADSTSIFLYLCRLSNELNPSVPSSVTVYVERNGGIPCLTHTSQGPFPNTFWRKSFSDIEEADPYFKKFGELTFVIEFRAKQADDCIGGKSVKTSLWRNPVLCYESLSEDWAKVLEEGPDPDVEFLCSGQSIKAHGLVLLARSPVFAKMLHSEMVEGKTGKIQIEDMEPDRLKQFVRYLYTGKLTGGDLTFDEAMGFYECADKYEVKSLARRCAQSLVKSLTVQNACSVLVLADAHCDDELKEAVIVFMLKNKVPIASDQWPGFRSSHPVLAVKIYSRFVEMHISNF